MKTEKKDIIEAHKESVNDLLECLVDLVQEIKKIEFKNE